MDVFKLIQFLPLCEDVNSKIKNMWVDTFKVKGVGYINSDNIIVTRGKPCNIIRYSLYVTHNGYRQHHYILKNIFNGDLCILMIYVSETILVYI